MKHFLLITLSCITLNAFASDFSVKNSDGFDICYNYINEGTELEVAGIKDFDYNNVYIIPDEVTYMGRTRKVTAIGDGAFFGKYGLIVILPETLKSIGDDAFYDCYSIKSIFIPDGVESIGKRAFSRCHIEKISLGKGLKTIGEDCFPSYGNTAVDTVIVRDLKAFCSIKGGGVFSSCMGQRLLFSDEKTMITDLVLPEGIENIGNFSGCQSIQSVTIPSGITDPGRFTGCTNLVKVVLPNTITTIGSYEAFCNTSLESINFPQSLKSIGWNSFRNCKLEHVTIPENVTEIGICAFAYCPLISVDISASVKRIGFKAFYSETLLTVNSSINDPENTPAGGELTSGKDTWFENAFSRNTLMNATLNVPKGTKEKYKAAEGWKEFVFIEEGLPSGINVISKEKNGNFDIYNLQGQKVRSNATSLEGLAKGVYIINGKTVVVK